jgi:uncharacterized RDD family membrane protein YckC
MEDNIAYAGFWKRFLAHILDRIILGFVLGILFVPVWIFFILNFMANQENINCEEYASVSFNPQWNDEVSIAMIIAIIVIAIIFSFMALIVEWLYFAFMESSNKQATFGKIIVGIKVVDYNSGKISFGQATGRYFGKILSGIILGIGFFMAAFTKKKQALHDILASCLVVNKFNFSKSFVNKKSGLLNKNDLLNSDREDL